MADQPARAKDHDPGSRILDHARAHARRREPLSAARRGRNLTAAIPAMASISRCLHHCNLCVRACREVQVNDVNGMAGASP